MRLINHPKQTLSSPLVILIRVAFVMLLAVLVTTPLKAAENIQIIKIHDGKELTLNGIGRAKKLADSFYLGALYLEQPFRSVDNITYINNYKRMRIKIASKRVSARRFAQYWKEAISINSPRNIWEPQVKDVLAFTQFFKNTLKTGDIVDIDFIPAMGTYIHINGTAMGRIRNPGFYNLLMMAWLGNRPPNEQFKLGVMGGNDGTTAIKLQQEFVSLNPSSARIAESKTWLTDAPAKKAKKVTQKKSSPKKKAKPKTKPKTTPKKVASSPAKKSTKNVKTSNNKTVATVAAATPEVKVPAIKTSSSSKKNKAQSKPKKSTENKQSKKTVVKEVKPLTSSQKLKLYALRSGYEKELRSTIRKYQYYPLRRMLRNRSYKKQMEKGKIESEGVLWVKIARDGAVISSRLEQSTGIDILDKAAIDMVEKADPLPEMPKELEGREFEFLVKLKFVSPELN